MKLFTLFIFLNISVNLVAQVQGNLKQRSVADHPISVIVDTTKNYQQPFISKVLQTSKENNICMSAAEMAFYNNESKAAKERYFSSLSKEGKPIPRKDGIAAHVLFDWPMRVSPRYDMQYKYFHKTNFVDQLREDTTVWGDYNCGTRTYDHHDASDISLWPFWWRIMDNEYVAAVAAAPGTIYFKLNGGNDRHCTSAEGTISNRIYIVHDDSSTTAIIT